MMSSRFEGGTKLVMGGSKGDDIACHAALVAELGIPADRLAYIATIRRVPRSPRSSANTSIS